MSSFMKSIDLAMAPKLYSDFSDILGLTRGPSPKFAKSYGNLGDAVVDAFRQYSGEVKGGQYPDTGHSYHMKAGEIERLKGLLKAKF